MGSVQLSQMQPKHIQRALSGLQWVLPIPLPRSRICWIGIFDKAFVVDMAHAHYYAPEHLILLCQSSWYFSTTWSDEYRDGLLATSRFL